MSLILNCRSCTRVCKEYKSLFEQNYIQEDINSLADLLQYCTNMRSSPDITDGMPQHICIVCAEMLEQAYSFKRMVLESDELLRQKMLENNNQQSYLMIEMEGHPTVGDTDEDTSTDVKKENAEFVETISEVDVEYVEADITASNAIELVTDNSIELATTEITEFVGEEVSQDSDEYIAADVKNEEMEYTSEMDCEYDEIEQHLEELDEETETEPEPEYILNDDDCGYVEDDDYDGNICDAVVDADGIERVCEEIGDNDDVEGDDNDNLVADVGALTVNSTKRCDALSNICDICGKGFRQQCRLRQHMQSHTTERHFTCEVCGKKLKHQKNYKEHVITHTDLKPHQCNICSRFYRTTSSLAAHKRTHAEDKPFKCDMCGRGFAAFDHMRRHKLTHTGERPFQCEQCDKAYYDSSSLRTHMISHTGVKAFTCEICGIGLTQKSGYKKHMLVHSGEKPHKCPICGRCFTFTSNLNAHIRLHSGEKPFKCDKCPKCFPTKKRLQSHQRVHNKEVTVCSTDGLSAYERKNALQREGQKSMPDMPDKQVSRSKVVVVL